MKSGIDGGELFDEYSFQKKGNDRGVRRKTGGQPWISWKWFFQGQGPSGRRR